MKEADEELVDGGNDSSISICCWYACLLWSYLCIRLVIPGHGHLDGDEGMFV